MKLEEPADLLRSMRIIPDVIGQQPEFVQPDVNQQNRQKTGEIKNVFLHRDWFAQGGGVKPYGCPRVRKQEEQMSEEKIQAKAEGNQDSKRSPECTPGNLYSHQAQKPDGDRRNGKSK